MAPDDLPPTLAGRYRPIRLLGRGGMGAVYEVEHVRTGQRLALKLLGAPAAASAEAVERFKREARAPSQIKSDHVVRVTDADVAPELGGAPFLVMELLEGSDLEEATRDGPASPADVVEWLRQVARGLDKAHERGIVHRDLKPGNLFLTRREDGGPLVKILDFGVAKILEDAQRTESGRLLGTPLYMAPEQADSTATNVSPQTDVFAVGLIAHRLLLGRSYWNPGTVKQLLSQILFDPMPAPSARGSSLGPAFDAWFARACAREPDKRFASAGEAVEQLAEAVEGAREGAATLSAQSTMVRSSRLPRGGRRPTRWGIVAALVTLLALVLAGRRVLSLSALPQHAPGPAPKPVSSNDEARRIYEEATRTWQRDSHRNGIAGWERAVALDPDLCAAWLRLALFDETLDAHRPERAERVRACKGRLSPEDQALSDLLPGLMADPPDGTSFEAAVQEAAARFPGSSEIAFVGELGAQRSGRRDAAVAWANRAIAIDPRFAQAYARKAEALRTKGETELADEALRACIAAAPANVLCSYYLLASLELSGRCADAEQFARRFIEERPSSGAGYRWLARALVGTGAPREAAEEAEQQGEAREGDAASASVQRKRAAIQFETAFGDFTAAAADLDAVNGQETAQADADKRWNTARWRALLWLEQGRTDAARDVVQDAVRRRVALVPQEDEAPGASGDLPVLYDVLDLEARLGLAPASTYDERTARAESQHPIADPFDRWRFRLVRDDPSPAEARDAVSAAPAREQLEAHLRVVGAKTAITAYYRGPIEDLLAVGRTLLRGGRPDLAVPWLARAAHQCVQLDSPIPRMHAWLDLGEGLSRTGDREGARQAYEEILRSWGSARPRSVTADEARRRLAAP